MSRIIFFVPATDTLEFARKVLSTDYPDISLEINASEEAVEKARALIPMGLEIAIARGGTYALLWEKLPELTVVEMPITNEDIVDAILKATRFGKKVAVVVLPSLMKAIKPLMSLFDYQIDLCEVQHPAEIAPAVLKAISQGAEILVGGGITYKTAKMNNTTAIMIGTCRESVLQAADKAVAIQHALHLKRIRLGEFSTIMDRITEGIITINHERIITGFNPMASKFTGIKYSGAIGKPITHVLPELGLEKVIDKGSEEFNKSLWINNAYLLCNLIPIMNDGHPLGAVATMHKFSQIEQMEASIRREVYSKGYVAKYTFDNILGESRSIKQCIAMAQEYAKTQSNVLLVGKSGTGKELFAQGIHNASARSNGPFIAINCAALPQSILESELFGYVGGAFTGANREGKPGLFELSHKGTLFLDEIAELSHDNQGRLLRVLQEKTIMRLGGDRVIPIDVRIISATNKDMSQMVAEGNFRDDLYYRLNVLRLTLAPLRERPEDIEIYANYYLKKYSQSLNKVLKFSRCAKTWLKRYEWPGNVRELENVMERIAAISPSRIINADILEAFGTDRNQNAVHAKEDKAYQRLVGALKQADGTISKAADILGIHRSTLWRQLKKHGVSF
jgi:transcriptional regulator with PAS, ATPase and Fis domain